MTIGHLTLEWKDGVPDKAGYYLALLQDGDIEQAFRRISIGPGGGLHCPPHWELQDSDCGWRECGSKCIVAWTQWPSGYEIVDTLQCLACGKDPGEAIEDDGMWRLKCQHCGEEGDWGCTKTEAETLWTARERLDKEGR